MSGINDILTELGNPTHSSQDVSLDGISVMSTYIRISLNHIADSSNTRQIYMRVYEYKTTQ